MDTQSTTYRTFAILTTILLVISITLPSVLMAAHCDMNMSDSSKNEVAGEYCPFMEAESTHGEQDHQTNKNNSSFSCDCDLDQLQTQTEAIPSISKTAKAFVASVIQYLNAERTSTPTVIVDVEFSLNNHFPPIFLLNSVFLN